MQASRDRSPVQRQLEFLGGKMKIYGWACSERPGEENVKQQFVSQVSLIRV